MTTEMSIAEGLQELKLVAQKLQQRRTNISRYGSKRRGTKDEVEKQKDFVKEQNQSALDLIKRYRDIKLAIAKSNIETTFEFNGITYSIAEAILYKQGIDRMYNNLYLSFTANNALQQIREHSRMIGVTTNVLGSEEMLETLDLIPELYYDEKDVQKNREDLLEFMSKINALIDKANHNTSITV